MFCKLNIFVVLSTFADFMGFKLFRRLSRRSTASRQEHRRRSFRLSLRRRSRSSRDETGNMENGDVRNFLRPRRAGEGQDAEARTSKEVGSALRAIGDELNSSALSLHCET